MEYGQRDSWHRYLLPYLSEVSPWYVGRFLSLMDDLGFLCSWTTFSQPRDVWDVLQISPPGSALVTACVCVRGSCVTMNCPQNGFFPSCLWLYITRNFCTLFWPEEHWSSSRNVSQQITSCFLLLVPGVFCYVQYIIPTHTLQLFFTYMTYIITQSPDLHQERAASFSFHPPPTFWAHHCKQQKKPTSWLQKKPTVFHAFFVL